MNHIEINYETIESLIDGMKTTLESKQAEIDEIYGNLVGQFSESSGEEADALRELQIVERKLVEELTNTVIQFGESIRFAANEFKTLDAAGASKMAE